MFTIEPRKPQPWYKRSGVWAGIIGAGVTVAGFYGNVDLTQGEIQSLAQGAATIATGIATVLAVFGSFKDEKK